MTINVVNIDGKQGQLEVSDAVFGLTPNANLLAQAIAVFQSNQRQGTSKVKTRADINRTKKKWYKQKGTGNARHGARTPNIFVGGGVSHGPTGMQDWSRTLTKMQKRKALGYALSARKEDFLVCPAVAELSGKTQDAAKLLDKVCGDAERVLVVLHTPLEKVIRSVKNIERALATQASRLNVYELLLADKIIITEEAVKILETRIAGTPGKEEKVVAPKTVAKPVKKAPAKKEVAPKTEKKAAPKKTAVKKTAKKVEK